jgi:cell division protease FtsH
MALDRLTKHEYSALAKGVPLDKTVKTLVFWLVIVISATLLWQVVKSGGNQSIPEISYSEFLSRVSAAKISKVTISGTRVVGESRDGSFFRVVVPANQQAMLEALQQQNTEIWFRDVSEGSWPTWLLNLAPLILLAAVWFFMIRQVQSKQRQTSIVGS